MATAPIYCTHKELKRVYPQIDAFDTKTPIYGWKLGSPNVFDSNTLDVYYSGNTGLITDLFWDGTKVDKITYNTTETTQIATAVEPDGTTFAVDSGTPFAANDILKVNNEYIQISSVSTNDLLTNPAGTYRGLFGTVNSHHAVDASVYRILDDSGDNFESTSKGDSISFVYDPDLDLCILITDGLDPNDYLVESGEEFTSLVTQFRTDASRYLDSKLDPNLSREQFKDKSGNFDYMIIRSAALIAAAFMIRASDPTNEVATALMEQSQGNINALNDGKASLSWQNTRDACRGTVRDITYTDGSMRPVDTRGTWSGTFDIIKVKIIDAGAMGTATYSVWEKSGDKLGINEGNQVVTAEKINGDYQALAGGLQVRFAGETKDSTATANNEWEIEVMGENEHIDASGVKSVHNSRWL